MGQFFKTEVNDGLSPSRSQGGPLWGLHAPLGAEPHQQLQRSRDTQLPQESRMEGGDWTWQLRGKTAARRQMLGPQEVLGPQEDCFCSEISGVITDGELATDKKGKQTFYLDWEATGFQLLENSPGGRLGALQSIGTSQPWFYPD